MKIVERAMISALGVIVLIVLIMPACLTMDGFSVKALLALTIVKIIISVLTLVGVIWTICFVHDRLYEWNYKRNMNKKNKKD